MSTDLTSEPENTSAELDIDRSRALAVDRIFKGGIVWLAGIALGVAFLQVTSGSVAVAVGVTTTMTALIGIGGVWAGRGARHLLRFGRRGSALGLLAVGGMGVWGRYSASASS